MPIDREDRERVDREIAILLALLGIFIDMVFGKRSPWLYALAFFVIFQVMYILGPVVEYRDRVKFWPWFAISVILSAAIYATTSLHLSIFVMVGFFLFVFIVVHAIRSRFPRALVTHSEKET
jgi:hypothetical protein